MGVYNNLNAAKAYVVGYIANGKEAYNYSPPDYTSLGIYSAKIIGKAIFGDEWDVPDVEMK